MSESNRYRFIDLGEEAEDTLPLPEIDSGPKKHKVKKLPHKIKRASPQLKKENKVDEFDLEPVVVEQEFDDTKVLRSTSKATIKIKKLGISFRKPGDVYPVHKLEEKYGKEVWENKDLKRMMDMGLLEVKPMSEAKSLSKKWKQDVADMAKKSKKSILYDRRNDDYADPTDDIIEIDVSDDSYILTHH